MDVRIGGAIAAGVLAAAAASLPPVQAPVTVLAAGDIAVCHAQHDEATAAIVDSIPGEVLALGDEAYATGSARDFAQCYAPSWGRFKARTHPTPGNHEYYTPGAAPYFAYFGAAAGPAHRGWYSFDLGAWHVVSLNSNLGVEPGGAQERWLRADLAAHPAKCTLAFWHHARFSSGPHGSTPPMAALWRVLQQAGADVVLAGHDHHYERFAPMTADGAVDARHGIRSFVVGTGGGELYPFLAPVPGSQVRWAGGYGVLKLTLRADRYDWEFLAVGGAKVDHGSARCH